VTSGPRRRFPAPWRVTENPESFAVTNAAGFILAYVYFAEGQRASVMGRMTRDEARRIAVNMARLPELLGHRGNDESPEAEAPGRNASGEG
jgi:hypothetical protein